MVQQDGAIAGRPTQEDDVVTGAVVKSARSSGKTARTSRSGGSSVLKNKSRNKGTSSQKTAPANVQTSSQDKQRSTSNPATRQELIDRIKSMPDEMLPQFIKPYAEIMVDKFKIDTREKVANFFGQIAAESLRGNAEYVYYTNQKSFKKAFGGRVKPQHINDFLYKDPSTSRPFGFSPEKAPWNIGGWPDVYYGGKNGNKRGQVSVAKNDFKPFGPTQQLSNNERRTNPHYYKGSSEGYSYRGHGVIQITGKVQYEYMNEFFGRNGKYEKNDIDFLENPEIVSYNWNDKLGHPNKFAFLSALMWWSNHNEVYINQVSLSTTQKITARVKGSSAEYQERHKNVERYFSFLVNGTKPAQVQTGGTMNLSRPPTYTKVIKPSQLKFVSLQKAATASTYASSLSLKTFTNLSFFVSSGDPIDPYKDLVIDRPKDTYNKNYPVFTISKNGVAKIYKSDEVFPIWSSLNYVAAGWPRLLTNGKPWVGKASASFLRLTGRTAIGIKPSGELVIYVSDNKYVHDVINDLSSMGCTDAINFDGGGSTFLYVDGKQVLSSSRTFPNVMTWT